MLCPQKKKNPFSFYFLTNVTLLNVSLTEAGQVLFLLNEEKPTRCYSLSTAVLCCAVALRRTAWSGMAWARHGKCESDTAALCKSNGKDTF